MKYVSSSILLAIVRNYNLLQKFFMGFEQTRYESGSWKFTFDRFLVYARSASLFRRSMNASPLR